MTASQGFTNKSVRIINRIDVLEGGNYLGTLDTYITGAGTGAGGGNSTGGSITLDTTATNMRSCTFTCLDPNGVLAATDAGGGLFAPTGVEVKISVGFMVDGNAYLWPQGVFGVTECDTVTGTGTNSAPGPVLTITGYDRSSRVAANELPDTVTIAAGSTITQAIYDIINLAAPWITNPNIEASTMTIAAQTFLAGSSPWTAITTMAAAVGMVAYFDANGTLIVRTAPTTANSPVELAIQDGQTQIATDLTHAVTNQPGYNGVIVTSTTASSAPVTGVAWDMDPSSPTYALGPYGFRPTTVQVSTATTPAQCNAVAAALLPQILGLTRQITLNSIPVPFLDAYDLIYVNNANTAINGTYVLQQATIPMDFSTTESMTLVPVGSQISALVNLNNVPSVAAFAPTTPLSTGSGAYTAGIYTAYSASGASSTSLGGGALGLAAFGLLGGFGGAGLLQLLWPNGFGRRFTRRILLDGGGNWTSNAASDAASEVEGFTRGVL